MDSEVILRAIEKDWWKGIPELEDLSGSMACAMLWEKRPTEVILFKHGNPIELAYDDNDDVMYWASSSSALERALLEEKRGIKWAKSIRFATVGDGAALLIGKEGVKERATFAPLTQTAWYNSRRLFTGGRSFGGAGTETVHDADAENLNLQMNRGTALYSDDSTPGKSKVGRCELCRMDKQRLKVRTGSAIGIAGGG